MTQKSKISLELLAPAGNVEIGRAAIDYGADAVYIGASHFSARANAANSMDNISKLIDYAHLFNARVYIALNTILNDSEILDAVNIIKDAYQAEADGIIIQDTGLIEQNLPPIPFIASTQMNNATPEKVKFLQDVGFSRVILARELTLNEIREIRAKTDVELECFVHGALCVSYSGQCCLSQAVFGRSGNRGVCAQPCRLKYTLKDGTGKTVISNKHLLSLKDLNLIEHIKDLAEAGITSFKIEGRYKDTAYVKNVVAAYRQAVDSFIQTNKEYKTTPAAANNKKYKKQSSGDIEFKFQPDLQKTFNRGYTKYFLFHSKESNFDKLDFDKFNSNNSNNLNFNEPDCNKPGCNKSDFDKLNLNKSNPNNSKKIEKQGAVDTPKSTGAEIGKITHLNKKKKSFSIQSKVSIHNGDGMCFVNKYGELKGFRVDKVENGYIFPNDIEGLTVGVTLFRNHDHQFLKILDKKMAERKINVSMIFNQSETEISLTVKDEDGYQVESHLEIPYQEAKQPDKVKMQIISQLTSTGNTIFKVIDFIINSFVISNSSVPDLLKTYPLIGFLQLSTLNSLRRDALEKLEQLRVSSYKVKQRIAEVSPLSLYPEKLLDYRANVLNKHAVDFYEKHGASVSEKALETGEAGINFRNKILMTTRYCIRSEIGACLKQHKYQQLILEPPITLTDGRRVYNLHFNCIKCEMSLFLAI